MAGKALATDGRGAPRPAEGGCDTGAVERRACQGVFVTGPDSAIGRDEDEEIQGSSGAADVVLAQGGDDYIGTHAGEDTICAGKGDDLMQPQAGDDEVAGGPGVDTVNYNNAMAGGIGLDLAALLAVGPSIGTDALAGIEDAQGSEADDDVLGDSGPNLLIGGGGDDELEGRGGIDIIDAREPGNSDPDVVIDCGPGDNSKEKAIVDPEDPDPISC